MDETGARAAAEVVEVGETLAVHSRTVHCSTSWAGAGYTGHTIWDGANLATTPVGPQGAQAAGGNVTVSKLLPSVPGELKQLYVNALEMKQRNVARLAQTPVENSIGLQSNETALQETESETDTGTAQQAVLAPQPETPRPGTEAAGREVVPSTSRATVRYTSVVGSQGGPGSARHVRLPAQPQAPSHNSNSVEMSSQDRMPELRYKVLKMTLEVPAEWKGVEELLVVRRHRPLCPPTTSYRCYLLLSMSPFLPPAETPLLNVACTFRPRMLRCGESWFHSWQRERPATLLLPLAAFRPLSRGST